MHRLITLRQALEDPDWLGGMLGAETFRTMRTLLIAAFGEALSAEELEIFTSVTGRVVAPTEPCSELWIIAGRRSGKSLAIAVLGAYLAACVDYRTVLARGERGILPIMAANTQQGQIFNFMRGIFTGIPRFAALVQQLGGRHGGITSQEISLKNHVDIQIRPANFRTIRGITAIAVIAEETTMWFSDELGSRNADTEILNGARPCLATTNGMLFSIGSPHARRGESWKTFKRHLGVDDSPEILVANGPTRTFNPTIRQSVIDRAYAEDPAVAASE